MAGRKTTTLTVDRETFDEAYRLLFNDLARSQEIPRGELLCRAIHLVSVELTGEHLTEWSIEALRTWVKKHHPERYDLDKS